MVTQQELPACKPILTPKWVTKRMKQPIYVYYQLDNYYQNYRRYVKSRSDQQLRNRGNENGTNTCKPEQKGHFMEE
ncbi:putative CDC50/LEM3 family protein [Helianthus anomalus]